jgi:hypothetical protein
MDLEQVALDVRQAYDELRGANSSAPTAGEIAAYASGGPGCARAAGARDQGVARRGITAAFAERCSS